MPFGLKGEKMQIAPEVQRVIEEDIEDCLVLMYAMSKRGDLASATQAKLDMLSMMLRQFSRGEPNIIDFQEEVLFETLCFALDRLTLMEAYGDLSESGREKLSHKRIVMERLMLELKKPEKHSRLQFVADTIFLAPAELVRMGLLTLIPENMRLKLLDRYRKDQAKGRLAWISQFFYDLLTTRTH